MNDYPTVIVEDTGIGIPKEDIDRIFERFYRVDKSHSNQKEGSGLGLSIVKHGAKFHHAEMEVESEVGKGTKITVIFPKQNLICSRFACGVRKRKQIFERIRWQPGIFESVFGKR